MDTRAASLSLKKRIASLTFVLLESGRYGDSSEAVRTPMTAATKGHGFRHSCGPIDLSAVSAAAM